MNVRGNSLLDVAANRSHADMSCNRSVNVINYVCITSQCLTCGDPTSIYEVEGISQSSDDLQIGQKSHMLFKLFLTDITLYHAYNDDYIQRMPTDADNVQLSEPQNSFQVLFYEI